MIASKESWVFIKTDLRLIRTFRPFFRKVSSAKGFSLIELVAIVAVLSVLGQLVVPRVQRALVRAKVIAAVSQLRHLQKLSLLYIYDTGRTPNCASECRADIDPFRNKLGVDGWSGPYGSNYDNKHLWGGHVSVWSQDFDGDGFIDCAVVLNDDRPGTNEADIGGRIPAAALREIDKIVDDGNLGTGIARGDGLGYTSGVGELVLQCGR
jgi:general secretion pathway protein G